MQHHKQGQQPHTVLRLNFDTFYEQQMLMGLSTPERTVSGNKSFFEEDILKDT